MLVSSSEKSGWVVGGVNCNGEVWFVMWGELGCGVGDVVVVVAVVVAGG